MGQNPDSAEGPLLELYHRLYAAYGPQHWWPSDSKFEMVLGAILTQAAAWSNVEKALDNLKAAACFSPEALRDIPERELASIIRPSGYFNAKAKKLKAFIGHLWDHYQGNLEMLLSKDGAALRSELLTIHGIGEETADDIVLYAAEQPSFVIDTYTRRILGRLGMAPADHSYRAYQELFHRGLQADAVLFNEYHALLDYHAKETCRKDPRCAYCCLLEMCPTGRGQVSEGTGRDGSASTLVLH